jgi:hypothetical protein
MSAQGYKFIFAVIYNSESSSTVKSPSNIVQHKEDSVSSTIMMNVTFY